MGTSEPASTRLQVRILHLEDNPADAELIRRDLRQNGIDAETVVVDAAVPFQERLRGESFDLVISDYNLPGAWNGLDALAFVRSAKPTLPFIFVSGNLGEEKAIDAMKRGATDYVLKDRMGRMPSAVRRAIDEARERERLRRVEEQLLHAQKMEAVGRLAGGVAHDFNNLLTVINGYSELLLATTPDQDARRTDLQEIHSAGHRAAGLTRQLLAFSRRQIFTPVTLDLNVLLQNLQKMLARLIEEDVELRLNLAPDLAPVNADPGQIEQVVVNLVVNARDAMPRGGRIVLETSNATLDDDYVRAHPESSAGPHAVLSVSDTGTGMSAEIRAHLFEPFFTTKEKGKGTGLGLSTVHGIVRQSGGSIEVRSQEGQGTTFRIHLPRARDVRLAPSAAPSAAPTGRTSETILVAEDMDTVRRLAKAILEAAGWVVLEARDGTDALRICEEHRGEIHLLLTDVVMHAISGPELAALFRRRHPETRILYMSGYGDRDFPELDRPQNRAHFLQKPFTVQGLRAKVREVLDAAQTPPS